MARIITRLGLLLLVLAISAPQLFAESLNGNWAIVLNTEDGNREASVTFQLNDEVVTGKWGPFDVKGRFVANTLNLKFPITVPDQGMKGDLKIIASLDGDKLTGKWEFEGYSGTLKGTQAQVADLTGPWQFIFDTEGGERRIPATFQVDGERVAGKMGAADVKGTATARMLDLKFPFTSEESGTTADLTIKGKLEADQLSGTWEFDSHRGTWKASRGK